MRRRKKKKKKKKKGRRSSALQFQDALRHSDLPLTTTTTTAQVVEYHYLYVTLPIRAAVAHYLLTPILNLFFLVNVTSN